MRPGTPPAAATNPLEKVTLQQGHGGDDARGGASGVAVQLQLAGHHARHVLCVGRRTGAAAVDVGGDEVDFLAVFVGHRGARGGARVGAQHHAVLQGQPGGAVRKVVRHRRVRCNGFRCLCRPRQQGARRGDAGGAVLGTGQPPSPSRRALKITPAMVVPVFVKPGCFAPRASKNSFRLHRSKLKPPCCGAAAILTGQLRQIRPPGGRGSVLSLTIRGGSGEGDEKEVHLLHLLVHGDDSSGQAQRGVQASQQSRYSMAGRHERLLGSCSGRLLRLR